MIRTYTIRLDRALIVATEETVFYLDLLDGSSWSLPIDTVLDLIGSCDLTSR